MKIAIEAIYDPYGGLFTHTRRFKKFSKHRVQEVPSVFTRKFLCRNTWLKSKYRAILEDKGIIGFDIIHSRSDPWFIDLCNRSRSDECKWVHTYHTLFFEEHYKDGLKPWQIDINRSLIEVACGADLKISVSQWGHDYLLEKYSIDTTVVVNGADLELCSHADKNRFYRKFGYKDFVLFVGSFREVKNPLLYLELAREMKEITFLMVGDGIDEKTLASKYETSIPANLKLCGRMDHMDALDATEASSAYVMTSKSEGLPNGLLEAMALGSPVVVPDHTGCKELVPNEKYGYLYDVNSLEDLIVKTKSALNGGETTQAARERIVEHYNWQKSAEKLDTLYDSLR